MTKTNESTLHEKPIVEENRWLSKLWFWWK